MAYETGSAASPSDLLDKLRAFVAANGWTVNDFSTVGSGKRLHISKANIYANFRAWQNETLVGNNTELNADSISNFWGIGGNLSTGWSGTGTVWSRQVGFPNYGTTPYPRGGYVVNLSSAIPTYHFFTYTDINEVHVVLEFITGKFQYFGFGKLDMYNGSAFGGEWMSMPSYNPATSMLPYSNGQDANSAPSMIPFRSCWYSTAAASSFVRLNVDSIDGWGFDAPYSSASYSSLAVVGPSYYDQDMETGTTSPYNWQTQLLSYMICVLRSNTRASPIGEIKYFRKLDMTNFTAAEEVTLGSDVWKIFPHYQKNGYSLNRGFAIKKVP